MPEDGVRTGCSARIVVAGVRPSSETGGGVRVCSSPNEPFGNGGGDGDGDDRGDNMEERLNSRSGMDRGMD